MFYFAPFLNELLWHIGQIIAFNFLIWGEAMSSGLRNLASKKLETSLSCDAQHILIQVTRLASPRSEAQVHVCLPLGGAPG